MEKVFNTAACVVSLNTCHNLQHLLSLYKLSWFQPDEDGTLSCFWKNVKLSLTRKNHILALTLKLLKITVSTIIATLSQDTNINNAEMP